MVPSEALAEEGGFESIQHKAVPSYGWQAMFYAYVFHSIETRSMNPRLIANQKRQTFCPDVCEFPCALVPAWRHASAAGSFSLTFFRNWKFPIDVGTFALRGLPSVDHIVQCRAYLFAFVFKFVIPIAEVLP